MNILETWVGIVLLVIGINRVSLFMIKKEVPILAWFLLVIVTIMSAVRNNIGEDYSSYIELFFLCDVMDEILPYPEISFQILSTIIQKAELGYQCVFAFYSVAIAVFIWKSAKVYVKDRRYVLLFISLWIISAFDMGWWFSMNVVRQYLAIAILLYAYRYLIENNNKKYIIWCLIAAFIHISALAMLVLPLVLKMHISKGKYVILTCIAIVLSFTSFKYIWASWTISQLGIYENYIDFVPLDTDVGLGLSAWFFLFQFLFLIKQLDWNIRDEYVIGVLLSLCTMMKFMLVRPYSRIVAFFSAVFIIAWIILLCKNKIRQKALLITSIVFVYSVTFLYGINAAQTGHDTDLRASAGNITYKANLSFGDDR